MTSPYIRAQEHLDAVQRRALSTSRDTIVLAGPGSGKTAILVLRVARLLKDLPPARSVACITFGTEAAREFTERLSLLGIRPGRRLFLGTVHAFCLREILGPLAQLGGRPDLRSPRVLAQRASQGVLQEALDEVGVNEQAERFALTISRLRQARAVGIEPTGFADTDPAVADAYEALLQSRHAVDFDGIVFEALNLLRNFDWARSLVASRFAWLVVDEYQDLTAPLHELLMLLRQGGSHLFAVGDPDQSIFAFTGGDPANLETLANDPDFEVLQLPFNYRAGTRLIAASQAALASQRDYHPDPLRTDPGEVYLREVEGGFAGQATEIAANIIPSLLAGGTPLHEIGIFVRQRGSLLDLIHAQLELQDYPVASERDDRWPRSPVIKFLQKAAAYALAQDTPGSGFGTLDRQLAGYTRLLGDPSRTRLPRSRSLMRALRASPTESLERWLHRFEAEVGFRSILSSAPEFAGDLEEFESLETFVEANPAVALADFAEGSRDGGKLVLTTYHGAKGREFDAVVLPGLQDQLLPRASWDRTRGAWTWRPATIMEDRRLFYVGLTRARQTAVLIWSPSWTNDYGYRQVDGASRFVTEVESRLAGTDAA